MELHQINQSTNNQFTSIGNGISIKTTTTYVEVWRNGGFLFRKELDHREITPEFRYLLIELVKDYKAQKTKLCRLFSMSRQTLDNWINSYEKYGHKGLINSTKNIGNSNRTKGNKARQHEAARREEKMKLEKQMPDLFDIQLSQPQSIEESDQPYDTVLEKQPNRYAGVFAIIILLVSEFIWFNWIIGIYGKGYKIFQVFVFMAAKNIRSIEQLKNIRQKEAGSIIGLSTIGSVSNVWSMFYESFRQKLAERLIRSFFVWQMRIGHICSRFWFIDGHVLPYTGNKRMHKIYNTKRRLAEPGCTNYVTADIRGNIVDFDIYEGGSNLRDYLFDQQNKWKDYLQKNDTPVRVFDKEGNGKDFFHKMIQNKMPFITWEKNADRKKIASLEQDYFKLKTTINEIEYRYIENTKTFTLEQEQNTGSEKEKISFTLRRFYIWNTSNNKRTSGLAYDGNTSLSSEDCIYGILNRWGASENTFKYLDSKHPLSYRPGFNTIKSEDQTIANPKIKEIEKEIKIKEKEYQKNCETLASKEKRMNKSGELRSNDAYTRIKESIYKLKEEISRLKHEKKQLPQRVDIKHLQDYKEYRKHDNQGKNMFDFVTSLVWNSGKKGIEILKNYYPFENDIVDLFYAIINCQGTVSINEKQIKVTLEPLEQVSRRKAQIEFCNRLTQMGAKTPNKKNMIIQVEKQ